MRIASNQVKNAIPKPHLYLIIPIRFTTPAHEGDSKPLSVSKSADQGSCPIEILQSV